MTAIRRDERDLRLDHLVRREGVAPEDASAFLDVLEALEGSDPSFHADIAHELDGLVLRAGVADAARARSALERLASARDTRATPAEVRSLQALAGRVAGHA